MQPQKNTNLVYFCQSYDKNVVRFATVIRLGVAIAIPGLNSQFRDPGLRNVQSQNPISGFGL